MNNRLLLHFRESGLTAYRLHKLTGLAQSTIHRWLKGETDLNLENFQKVAEALGFKLLLSPVNSQEAIA